LIKFADGYGTAAPVTDAQFHGYCRAFGVDSSDPRFATVMDRNANGDALIELMRDVVTRAANMDMATAIAALEAEDVPCSPAMELAELPAHPQMVANDSFARVEHPVGGTLVEPNNPPNFSATPSAPLRPAAALGEHTDAILQEIGRSDEQIAALRGQGAVA
jgi:crotonobetainyl-CoA:carnitine CoA-transferase CaiB-like acyl-CoA transferase